LIVDHASYHTSKEVKELVERHHNKIQLFFLPPHSPELNPDEQVWNQIKHRGVEKEPIKNKKDLEHRLYVDLEKLKKNVERIGPVNFPVMKY
jgi:transposase